jgi:hypothetical protein
MAVGAAKLTFLQIHHHRNVLELGTLLGRELDVSQRPASGLQLPLHVDQGVTPRTGRQDDAVGDPTGAVSGDDSDGLFCGVIQQQ